MFDDIPGYAFVDILPIEKGVSGDKKYRVKTTDNRLMLLRISDISELERKKTMFGMMESVAALGVPMSSPIQFGTCNSGKNVFQLLSWCDGDTADVILPSLSENQQYQLGFRAGEILRDIHTIPAPNGLTNWYNRYISKNDERVKAFLNCGVKFDGSDLLYTIYEQDKDLLYDRPQCFTHGDYHCDNLMVSDNMEISVIDWDLFDDNIFGDPWHEFTRILNADVIPHFTTGMLCGYFGDEPPKEFWRLLRFYFCAGVLQLVSWSVYVEPSYLEECKQTAHNVLSWYDSMRSITPSWYIKHH